MSAYSGDISSDALSTSCRRRGGSGQRAPGEGFDFSEAEQFEFFESADAGATTGKVIGGVSLSVGFHFHGLFE